MAPLPAPPAPGPRQPAQWLTAGLCCRGREDRDHTGCYLPSHGQTYTALLLTPLLPPLLLPLLAPLLPVGVRRLGPGVAGLETEQVCLVSLLSVPVTGGQSGRQPGAIF